MIKLLETQEEFQQATKLFEQWNIPSKIFETFSTTGIGYFSEEGTLQGVMFVYFTNSPVAILDNLCVDKTLEKSKRSQIIDELVTFATEEIKKTKTYKFILAEPLFKKSRERLKEYGFVETKDNKFWKEVA